MSRPAAALLLLLVAVSPLAAQRKDPTKRPLIHAGADTNDAYTYYNHGLEILEKQPGDAADAFYWAARINPGWAEALYARRVALLMDDRRLLQGYFRGERRIVRSREFKHLDSLQFRAMMQNPFLYEKLDRRLIDYYFRSLAEEATRGTNVSALEVEHWLQSSLQQSPAWLKARLAAGSGTFRLALDYYAQAIRQEKKKSDKAWLRVARGRLFYQIANADSAKAEFMLALEELRKEDDKDVVVLYQSKALLEHSMAKIHERTSDANAAREAYGRALEEDLSYYPAHVNLAYLALEMKDTATALNELDLAVQIRSDEPMLRYLYGHMLMSTKKHAEAETQLKKALELEPLFAMPHHALGMTYQEQGKTAEAATAYTTFLALAARTDGRRAEAEQRLAQLKSVTQAGATTP